MDYREKLKRLASVSNLREVNELLENNIDVRFDSPMEGKIEQIKSRYRFLPEKYLEFLRNYNGTLLGDFLFFGVDEGAPIDAIVAAESVDPRKERLFNDNCPIAVWNLKQIIFMSPDGAIWKLDKSNDFSTDKLSNSFDEFMDNYVFGEEYLNFKEKSNSIKFYHYLKDFFKE